MKKIARFSLLLLTCFSLSQCSSDESVADSGTLIVNGADFTIGTNSPTHTLNRIRSQSDTSLWLQITENTASGAKIISVSASHEPNATTGTYILKNDQFSTGIAVPALLDEETGAQISGGSADVQPTGTISITYIGGNRYKLAFNDVVLDSGTATETTITGECTHRKV